MEKGVFRSLNKWGCVLELLEVEGTAAVGCMWGQQGRRDMEISIGKQKKAMNLTLLSGTVQRSTL